MKTKQNRLTRLLRNILAITIRNMRYDRAHPEAAYMRSASMRNFMFYSMFLIVLVSCKPGEKLKTENDQALKTNTEVSKKTEATQTGNTSDQSKYKADSSAVRTQELIEKLTAEWEARLRTYDTSKPTNPDTGTPPLASELVMTKRNTADKKLTENVNTTTSQSAEMDKQTEWRNTVKQWLDSAMQANSRTISNTTSETKATGWPWWAWMLTGAALLALTWAVVRFGWWRKLSFILSFFR